MMFDPYMKTSINYFKRITQSKGSGKQKESAN